MSTLRSSKVEEGLWVEAIELRFSERFAKRLHLTVGSWGTIVAEQR